MAKKASVRDVRRINRALVLGHLLRAGETSRSEIGEVTGLSLATVTKVVSELIDEGTVCETGLVESAGGRPRVLLHLDPSSAFVVGSDVSETSITTSLFGLTLERIATRSTPFTDRRIAPGQVVDVIVGHVDALLEEIGIDLGRVLGLGLGVPGVVENPTEPDAVVHAQVIGWETAMFGSLEARLGVPVLIDNGAKTTTHAESWYGSARDVEHAVVVLIGDGAGAGIITNGRLYRGSSSSAGEWGHTKISLDGPACRCGSVGCVETFVGASAVLARWGAVSAVAVSESDAVSMLIGRYRSGAPDAITAIDTLLRDLGVALANLVNLYNPQKIIVGGWFGDLIAQEFLEELSASMRRFSLKQPGEEAVVERSLLGADAAVLGAATLPVDRFIETGLVPRKSLLTH